MTLKCPGSPGGVVVITGASSGIGKEYALYLDRRGYRVFAGATVRVMTRIGEEPVYLDLIADPHTSRDRAWSATNAILPFLCDAGVTSYCETQSEW